MEEEDTQNQDEFVKEVKTVFSNKSKAADAKQKIETFQQKKKHITDFMIEFEVLAIKAKTDDMHVIFLLKKNIRSNIIKTILGYLPIVALETLKEQKVANILVGQGYKFIESRNDYRIELEITYGSRGASMDIGKLKENYDKDRKPRCFNCNIYRYMTKDY